jgi:hypothetical protein
MSNELLPALIFRFRKKSLFPNIVFDNYLFETLPLIHTKDFSQSLFVSESLEGKYMMFNDFSVFNMHGFAVSVCICICIHAF